MAVMAGAVAHHGALIVRNLFGPEEVTAVREVIDVAHEAHAAGDTTDVGVAYRPLTTGAPTRTAALRSMVADDGGIWLADHGLPQLDARHLRLEQLVVTRGEEAPTPRQRADRPRMMSLMWTTPRHWPNSLTAMRSS